MSNEEIIDYLHKKNTYNYNLHKASEECQELGLVLNQFLLKSKKVKQQEIIDEIGDVIIRIEILKKMFPIELINERINKKLSKYQEYKDSEEYENI